MCPYPAIASYKAPGRPKLRIIARAHVWAWECSEVIRPVAHFAFFLWGGDQFDGLGDREDTVWKTSR